MNRNNVTNHLKQSEIPAIWKWCASSFRQTKCIKSFDFPVIFLTPKTRVYFQRSIADTGQSLLKTKLCKTKENGIFVLQDLLWVTVHIFKQQRIST